MQTMIPQKPRREAETRPDAMAVILIKQVKVRERMWRMQKTKVSRTSSFVSSRVPELNGSRGRILKL